MINPFKHVGNVVSAMMRATENDCFDPTTLKVIISPAVLVVAPVAFVTAFFKKAE